MPTHTPTVSIGEAVIKILTHSSEEAAIFFKRKPDYAEVGFVDWALSLNDYERISAEVSHADPGTIQNLTIERSLIEALIKQGESISGKLEAAFKPGKSEHEHPTLQFNSIDTAGEDTDIEAFHITCASAFVWADQEYGITIPEWAPDDESAPSSENLPNPAAPLSESDHIILLLAWLIHEHIRMKFPTRWSELVDKEGFAGGGILSLQTESINNLSKRLSTHIDMTGGIERNIDTYVKQANKVIADKWAVAAPITAKRMKGASRALYAMGLELVGRLAHGELESKKIRSSSADFAAFLTDKLSSPPTMSDEQMTVCLLKCWETTTKWVEDKKPPAK